MDFIHFCCYQTVNRVARLGVALAGSSSRMCAARCDGDGEPTGMNPDPANRPAIASLV